MRIFISKRKDYMDIFEEKRQLIEKFACQKEYTLESKMELKQLLLKDTNGGKLYKYRSFDEDGYSLKNLEEGTLHCSLVEAFNDPFDSKLGYTLESIYKGVLGDKLEKIFLLIQACKNVLEEKTKLEEYNVDEQNEIKKYLSNKKIKASLEKLICKINCDAENMNDVVYMFFELLILTYKNENTIKLLGTDIGSSLQILLSVLQENNLKIDDLGNLDLTYFANIMGIKEDADEVDTTLQLNRKFCQNQNNDTDEASEVIDKFDKELNEWTNNIVRVGCLGTEYKNKLMWSHYADSHTGFCIEYDFNNIKWENLLVYPLPVLYSKERPLIPYYIWGGKDIEKVKKELMIGLLTKDIVWSYENEWRYIISKQDKTELVMPPISCIYLGANIENDNKIKIMNIAKKFNIPVKQMTIDRGKYDLHAKDI